MTPHDIKRLKGRSMKITIFFILIALWVTFSFFYLFYNLAKSVSEVRTWAFLSDSEKRYKIYGDIYSFLIFIQSHTVSGKRILIFSEDVKAHYLSIYYLYPKITQTTDDYKSLSKLIDTNHFDYVALHKFHMDIPNYELVATYGAKMSKNGFGFLYKLR